MATDCKTARARARGNSPESKRLLVLLRQRIGAGESKRITQRYLQLKKLFAALPPSRAEKLLDRLNDPKDLLGVLFDCELMTETRDELRELLVKGKAPAPPKRKSKSGAPNDRATGPTDATDRSTTQTAVDPKERSTNPSQTGVSTKSNQRPANCESLWNKYQDSARMVLRRAKPTNHRLRNMLITAHYAQLYLGNQEFKWAGFAAYASKQVGCAMEHSQRIVRLVTSGGSHYALKQADEKALGSWDRIAANWAGPTALGLAKLMYAKLGEGNQKLFMDIYPPHLFFINHGYKRMRECGPSRKPPLPSDLLEGFRLIEESRTSKNTSKLLQESVAAMARHEQLEILQPLIYDDEDMQAVLDLNELDLPGTDPAKAILTSDCIDPGEKNTYYLNNKQDGSKKLYNRKHRMEWILDRIAPHYFKLEGSSRHIDDLNALTKILYY